MLQFACQKTRKMKKEIENTARSQVLEEIENIEKQIKKPHDTITNRQNDTKMNQSDYITNRRFTN